MSVRRWSKSRGELLVLGAAVAVSGMALMLARDLRGYRRLHGTWTDVGGRRLFVRAGGPPDGATDSVPVMLVHGYGMSSRYMIPTAARLVPEMVVYAPDLPGHGHSDAPPAPMRVPELADTLVAWMDATGIERASLLGHSFGCQVVANIAARHPDRVDRVLLVAPVVDTEADTIGQQATRLLASAFAERVSLALLLTLDYALAGERVLKEELRELVGYRIEHDLVRITAPGMVVRGSRDATVPDRWARRVAGWLRTDRLVTIPRGGHALNYSAPAALVDAIRPFLLEASGTDRLPRAVGAK